MSGEKTQRTTFTIEGIDLQTTWVGIKNFYKYIRFIHNTTVGSTVPQGLGVASMGARNPKSKSSGQELVNFKL